VFQRFIEKSPLSVMMRGVLERVLNPERLEEWFAQVAEHQYTRELLFSSVFDLMSQVVCGTHRSVDAAYQASEEAIGVSITSVYNKLNGLETTTPADLVRYAAGEAAPLIEQLGGARAPQLAGFRVKLLDGNCITASEHRIEELRSLGAGALPGKSLVVLDPALRIPIDVFPCEDGHAQERSLLGQVLPTVGAEEVWVADRNFCTRDFLCGIAAREAFFIIRQHRNLPFEPLTPMRRSVGRVATGQVFEQSLRVTEGSGKEWHFRRIRVLLNQVTRDGDKEIDVLTHLPREVASAKKIAELYRGRWTVETAFQELTEHLPSEINALGYPPAALFGFCVALVAYTVLAVVKAALASVVSAWIISPPVCQIML
ncbi:MAG: transposase, partial [Actinomycetota bacterium]